MPVGCCEGSQWYSVPSHHGATSLFIFYLFFLFFFIYIVMPSVFGSCWPLGTCSWLTWMVSTEVQVDGWFSWQHVGSLRPLHGDWKIPCGSVGNQTHVQHMWMWSSHATTQPLPPQSSLWSYFISCCWLDAIRASIIRQRRAKTSYRDEKKISADEGWTAPKNEHSCYLDLWKLRQINDKLQQ